MGKTIQGELNEVLKKFCRSENIHSIGASRTDAKVHARDQIVRIDIPLDISPEILPKALNGFLPQDIRILKAERTTRAFHPIGESKGKEYHYYFFQNNFYLPHFNELMTFYPYSLDIEKMKTACFLLEGKHNFFNYFCTGSEFKTTWKTIFSCSMEQVKNSHYELMPYEYFIFKISGEGFLKQMVRLLMGTLWGIGRNKISLDNFKYSLENKLEKKLGVCAPPQGLYLNKIDY